MFLDMNLKEFSTLTLGRRLAIIILKECLALVKNGRCLPGKSKEWMGYLMQWMVA